MSATDDDRQPQEKSQKQSPSSRSPTPALPLHAPSVKRSNQDLTDEEKLAKRMLKKRLKQQSRMRKLETRLKHAVVRRDKVTEEATRKELEAYAQQLQQEEGSILYNLPSSSSLSSGNGNGQINKSVASSSTMPQEESETIQQCRTFLEDQIYHRLIKECKDVDETGDKTYQTAQARTLLRNMTKGTQTESMFDNRSSLVGYTRQKFIERAMLAASSLDKLDTSPTTPESKTLFEEVLNAKAILSIGCGPGCDASGVLALQQVRQKRPTNMILMDFVIDHWKEAILDPLRTILVPEKVDSLQTVFCDIRLSLHDPKNSSALKEILKDVNDDDRDTKLSHVDLILISYVLTETRGKWRDFMKDLFALLKPGTLLLLSEPTAWQFHNLMDLVGHERVGHFEWLDSSRHTPELQPLENRVGPAVLLIRVR